MTRRSRVCLRQNTQNPFEPTNNFGKYFERRLDDFDNVEPEVLRVFLVWGLKEQDTSDCHWSEVDCDGDTRYDNSFDLESTENQLALLVSEGTWKL